MGCWENTRKACKSKAEGEWFTSFRVGYHAGKAIESVVYCLNLPELSKLCLCHLKPVLQHYKYLTINNRTNCLFLPITETLIIKLLKWEHAEIYRMLWAHNMPFQQKGLSIQNIRTFGKSKMADVLCSLCEFMFWRFCYKPLSFTPIHLPSNFILLHKT